MLWCISRSIIRTFCTLYASMEFTVFYIYQVYETFTQYIIADRLATKTSKCTGQKQLFLDRNNKWYIHYIGLWNLHCFCAETLLWKCTWLIMVHYMFYLAFNYYIPMNKYQLMSEKPKWKTCTVIFICRTYFIRLAL